jgi:DNA polymerase III epsilon subunit-like protein
MIYSVDGITDENIILGWLDALPVALRDELLEKIQVLHNWGIAFDCKFICKDCNKLVNKPTAINPINFFLTPYGQTIR